MLPRRRLGAPVLACLVSLTGGSAALGGSRFFTFQGTKPGDQLGIAVAGVQDVDHDGFDDIIIGAWQTETGRPGYAQVRSGRTAEVLFQWTGSAAGDLFGKAVAGAGDVNQDGYPDVLVGAPFKDGADFNAGAVDVYSGQNGKELYEFDGHSESDKFGSAVSAAGDVNGDGYADMLIGAPGDNGNGFNSGLAVVRSGRDGVLLLEFRGEHAYDSLGDSVAAAGDVNQDGFPDLIVGIPGSHQNTGRVRVFSGKDGALLLEFAGDLPDDILGHSVAGAGEVNGDGIPDLIAGAPLSGDANNGLVRVYSGKDGAVLYELTGANPGDTFGSAVSGGGDVDGDGRADFIVGVPFRDSVGGDSGTVTIFSGKTGAAILSFNGDRAGSHLGDAVASAGDLNHDGYADVIVGAPLDDGAANDAGFARVYSGKDYPSLWLNYGPGWPGTLGIPTFTSSADPAICSTITLDVGNSSGSYTTAAIMVGLAASYTPTMFDGILLVTPGWVISLQLPGGGFPFLATMPCDASLVGLAIFMQVLEVDAGASKGVSFSQGLELILGTQADG
jgi:hypothetical protein